MNQLPTRARLYVMVVLAAGALLFFTRLFSIRVDEPLLFLVLTLLSSAAWLRLHAAATTRRRIAALVNKRRTVMTGS